MQTITICKNHNAHVSNEIYDFPDIWIRGVRTWHPDFVRTSQFIADQCVHPSRYPRYQQNMIIIETTQPADFHAYNIESSKLEELRRDLSEYGHRARIEHIYRVDPDSAYLDYANQPGESLMETNPLGMYPDATGIRQEFSMPESLNTWPTHSVLKPVSDPSCTDI